MRLTRRHVIGASLVFLPGVAFARVLARPGRLFVLIVLRGAMDGLGAVPPLHDPDYAALRGPLAVDGALPLDGKFGLHPALAPVHDFYARGEMIIVHAMASPYRERSHFDAQNVIETGAIRPGMAGDGWLNRALVALRADSISGIAFTPEMPLVLKGAAPVANWQPQAKHDDISAAVTRMYGDDPALAAAYAQGLAAGGVVETASQGAPRKRDFASLALIAGKTLAAPDGPNVAVLEIGGWDTHVAQGSAKGRLANALGQLASGVAALRQGVGERWSQTVAVAVTEFGRTARGNGTGGTDHGTATAGFAFGGALAGGRVLADWPGLSQQALYQQRDLAPTADLRGFLKGLLGDHLGVPDAALEQHVFPGSATVRPIPALIRA
jgi:X-X-X-Leu-X-X-Gly heptad repeat protein